ncbi:MAG: hypothetical protein ABEJ93_00195 [Candidatus Nanohalobium sp.]
MEEQEARQQANRKALEEGEEEEGQIEKLEEEANKLVDDTDELSIEMETELEILETHVREEHNTAKATVESGLNLLRDADRDIAKLESRQEGQRKENLRDLREEIEEILDKGGDKIGKEMNVTSTLEKEVGKEEEEAEKLEENAEKLPKFSSGSRIVSLIKSLF